MSMYFVVGESAIFKTGRVHSYRDKIGPANHTEKYKSRRSDWRLQIVVKYYSVIKHTADPAQ